MEIAAHPPKAAEDLERMRGLSKGFAEGKMGAGLLAAIAAKLAGPKDGWPVVEREPELPRGIGPLVELLRSEEHTSELQSLMRISYAVFCLKKKKHTKDNRRYKM